MENSRFEESFRDAFSGAEVTPAEGVWTNIELSLEKASGGKMKRNLLLFQLLARDSGVAPKQVFFGVAVGGLEFAHGNGVAIDHGHQSARAAVIKVAHAPENKDEDDKRKGQFDAQGL